MIVGHGLIGQSFQKVDREDVLFFASGVSNSLETDPNQFAREENLLRAKLAEFPDKILVYFSTCSIYDSSKVHSKYVNHKLKMEQIVIENASQYLIARVSNAVGKGGNQNTLINYLIESIKNETQIKIHTHATRNLIDVADIVKIVIELIDTQQINQLVNVAYLYNYTILEILTHIQEHLQRSARFELVDEGQSYNIETREINHYFKKNQLLDKEVYFKNILKKYY